MCSCLCFFDTIVELHAIDEKRTMTFSFENESEIYVYRRFISFMIHIWRGHLSHKI